MRLGLTMKYSTLAVLLVFAAGCADTDPTTAPTQANLLSSAPTFYRFSDAAFAVAEKSGSFWAVKGQQRGIVLRYSDTGAAFMRFDVPAAALAQRPDGSAFQAGDSVQISVQVDAGGDFIFRFEPSGLKFNNAAPAVLTLDHSRTNPDINGDGRANLGDFVASLTGGIWKQELPILPWIKLPTLNLSTTARTDVDDFTGFGMAVN